jgi:hypothetical protein
MRAGAGAVPLSKRGEELGLGVGCDTYACIPHLDLHAGLLCAVPGTGDRHDDFAYFRKLDRIVHQRRQYSAQLARRPDDPGGDLVRDVGDEVKPLLLGGGGKRVEHLFNQSPKVKINTLKGSWRGPELGKVEQIIDAA